MGFINFNTKLLYKGFEFIQSSDSETIIMGFEILQLFKSTLKSNHHYYNKLIKYYKLLPTRSEKPNLRNICDLYIDFSIKIREKSYRDEYHPVVKQESVIIESQRLKYYFTS